MVNKSKQITFMLLLFWTSFMIAQTKTLKGVVLDSETKAPLTDVYIGVKNTYNGTYTDFDGNFSIDVTANDILVISYIGYKDQEISVGNQSYLEIIMMPDSDILDEIVVVGYGTQKKENITGAISQIKAQGVVESRPVSNILSAMQGVSPGFQITKSSGEPGNLGLLTNIRGYTSINGGVPIFLLDNVEVDPVNINPQDIENITILKDVAASSIYGARAAFGVVLLTTKQGKKNQKPRFNYSINTSFSFPEDLPKKASTYDFVNALNDFGVNNYWSGQNIDTWVGFLEEYKNNPSLYPNGVAVDGTGLEYSLQDNNLWDELFSDPAISQYHNLSVSGGFEKVSYRISGGFSDENGIIITDNDRFKKYNLSLNLNADITDKLTSTTNVFYLRSNRTSSISGFSRTVDYPNFAPVRGNHTFADGTEIPYNSAVNAEELLPPSQRLQNVTRLFQKIHYEPITNLNLIGEYTFERKTEDFYNYNIALSTVNPIDFSIIELDPSSSFYSRRNDHKKYNVLNLYANYSKNFNNHNFKATIGYNREETYLERFDGSARNLINVDYPQAGGTGTESFYNVFAEWGVVGYFGRLNYNFKNKYFLEGNIRWDGSSRFPSKDKYAAFSSFSGGWIVTEENFMKNINFLNFLKLRASYGELGNQNNNIYNPYDVYPSVPEFPSKEISWINPNTGLPAVTLGLPNIVSPSFTWERVQTINYGIDARFFNNKLTASFDLFTRNTLDMLALSKELPAVLGAGEPETNAADLQTKGWELEASWNGGNEDFSYNIGLALSDNQAKITKFENEEGLLNTFYVGKEINEIWGYVTDGYYTVKDFVPGTLDANLEGGTLKDDVPSIEGVSVNPGDVKFKDLNGDGVINNGNNTLNDSGDRKVIGNSTRRYQYGITGGLTYKNFDFSFIFNGVGKRDIWSNSASVFPYRGEFSAMYAHQTDYWTPNNTNAFLPRIYDRGGANYGSSRRTQTKYLLDGSYLRLKNITLGYSLPVDVLNNLKINSLRLFLSAENLANWDNLPDGLNTELKDRGNGAVYPFARTFSLGASVQF